ncbi:hypothetical protein ACLOJK_007363 [Asimina triloba]
MEAKELLDHIKEIQEQVQANLQISNAQYKKALDEHHHHLEYEEGDLVMVYLREESPTPPSLEDIGISSSFGSSKIMDILDEQTTTMRQ